MVDLSDRQIGAEIVAACRSGDRDAFRALYDFYKTRVYSIALYFHHGDAVAASDATQQVFLKLLRAHEKHIACVGKSLTAAAIRLELLGEMKVRADQIAQRAVILRIRQTTDGHRPEAFRS